MVAILTGANMWTLSMNKPVYLFFFFKMKFGLVIYIMSFKREAQSYVLFKQESLFDLN